MAPHDFSDPYLAIRMYGEPVRYCAGCAVNWRLGASVPPDGPSSQNRSKDEVRALVEEMVESLMGAWGTP